MVKAPRDVGEGQIHRGLGVHKTPTRKARVRAEELCGGRRFGA